MIGNMIEFKCCLSFFLFREEGVHASNVHMISIEVFGQSSPLQFVSSHGKKRHLLVQLGIYLILCCF